MGLKKHRSWSSISLACIAFALGNPTGHSLAQTNTTEITFEQIVAAPDDLQLNLAYARQQVAKGELQQAASALERLLLLRPNWDAARLFYGVVLYRLDDLEGAKRELSVLEGRGLSASQEKDRARYFALASRKTQSFRKSAQFSLGARLDSNPGLYADDVSLRPTGVNSEDVGFTVASKFRLEKDVDLNQGDYLFFQTNGFLNEFLSVNNADLVASRGKAGVVLHGSDKVFTPYVLFGTSFLQYEQFRHQLGGGVDTHWSLGSKVNFYLNGRVAYEDYHATSFSAVGNQRDGWNAAVSSALSWKFSDKQNFRLHGQWARKEAQNNGFAYNQGKIGVTSLSLLGEGRYLSLSASYTNTGFDQADNFNSTTITRKDDTFRGRAAYGTPLSILFQSTGIALPESIADIVLQVGVTVSKQDSTIQSLDHTNFSGDIMFTKRFTF